MTALKVVGYLGFSDDNKVVTREVLGVTPRTPPPSLDVRWPLGGVYILRLHTMRLLAIPKGRVRGRDPTPWVCTEPAKAWALWWGTSHLVAKVKRLRCPPGFWPKVGNVCPARVSNPCQFLFAGQGCSFCGKPRVEESP